MFTPVKVVRASEEVAEQIKAAIFSGKLASGDRLLPERELVREFGVSRVTIREAVRMLESAGVVYVKTGMSGGIFVAEATPQIVTDSLNTLLKMQGTTLREIAEARQIIETAIAALAAERADEAEIQALEQAVEHTRQAIHDGVSHASASVEFHMALAKAAKNRVLWSTVESFSGPLNDALTELGTQPEIRAWALEYHQKICDAVRRHDSGAARRLMATHLQQFESRLLDLLKDEPDAESVDAAS